MGRWTSVRPPMRATAVSMPMPCSRATTAARPSGRAGRASPATSASRPPRVRAPRRPARDRARARARVRVWGRADRRVWTCVACGVTSGAHGASACGRAQRGGAVAATRHRAAALATLAVPTLVVHGTDDDLMPFEHGRRLAMSIPDAAHLWLDGVGHVFPYPASADVEGAILAHLARAR